MLNPKAWRLLVAAGLFFECVAVGVADETATGPFVRLERTDISGKTGRPVKILEIWNGGQILRKDSAGAVRARAQLSARERGTVETLVMQPAMQGSTSDCGRPMGADLPQSELRVEYRRSTLVLTLAAHCRTPQIVQNLLTLLSAAERKYLPRPNE